MHARTGPPHTAISPSGLNQPLGDVQNLLRSLCCRPFSVVAVQQAAQWAAALSRLSTQVVNQSPYVESCSAFNTSYSDSGLFGVYSVTQPEKAGETAKAVAAALKSLTSVTADELKLAKSVLKGNLYRTCDTASELSRDLGTQVLLSGRYGSVADFAKIIDGVTADQLSTAAKKMLSSKPTVAAYGDTHTVPHYSAVEAALK